MASSDRDHGENTPQSIRNRARHATPQSALRQLASSIQGPRTPGYNASSRRTSMRRSPGFNTPHGLRARQRRQSAYTPGRDRRKSGRVQRETPLDILKNLGKVLAPTTRPISSSPEEEPEPKRDAIDELDDEPDVPRPRFSLPLNDLDEDEEDGSPDIPPPRLSVLPDDDDATQRSIEMPRRERTAREVATLARRSLTSTRFSDHFGDLSRMEDTEAMDVTVGQVGNDGEEDQADTTPGQPVFDAGGETEDLRRFNLDFSFPTPEGPADTALDVPIGGDDYEDFLLDTGNENAGAGASPQGDTGGVDFDIATTDQPAQRSPSPLPEGMQNEARGDQPKTKKLSRHGIPVPKLPSGIVKKLATRFARTGKGGNTRIPKDALAAIEQATEWFFEQASDDISAYSSHAGRKTIDESDVVALMQRQRHLGKNTSVFALAQKHLPRELLQDIRLSRR